MNNDNNTTKIIGYEVKELTGYLKPYYYLEGDSRFLGPEFHFPTVRRLKNYVKRMINQGKIQAQEVRYE
jgi:hypothetical protein